MKKKNAFLLLFLSFLFFGSCGYYNTFYNAKKYYKEGDYDRSLEKCDKILSRERYRSLHDDALFLKAQIYERTGEAGKALPLYRRLLTQDSQKEYEQKALYRLFFVHIEQEEYQEAYHLYERVKTVPHSREIDLAYAKLLFLLDYSDELEEMAEEYGTGDDFGREIALYSALALGRKPQVESLFGQFEERTRSHSLARLLFLMTSDPSFLPYLSEEMHQRYEAPVALLDRNLSEAEFNKYLGELDQLDITERGYLLKGLFRSFIRQGRLYEAKLTLLKLDALSSQKTSQSADNAMVMVRNTRVSYKDLPPDWKGFLTDGKNHYLYTDTFDIYHLSKDVWEKVNAAMPPEGIEDYSLTRWDSINKRWLFINGEKKEWFTLNSRDFSWDSILLEGDSLPRLIPERLFMHNRKLYYFSGVETVYIAEMRQKDKILVDSVDIKGWLPQISGYAVLDFSRYNHIALLGGKDGNINNFMGYTLDLSDPNPVWKEQYIASKNVLADYVITSLNVGQHTLLYLWDPYDEYEKPAKALLADFQPATEQITLLNISKMPEVVEDFFEFDKAGEDGRNVVITYRNPDTTFNSLIIYTIGVNIRFHTEQDDIRMGSDETFVVGGAPSKTKEPVDFLLKKVDEGVSTEKMIPVINSLIQTFAAPETDWERAGRLYLEGGFYPEAVFAYREALERSPDNARLLYALSYIYYRYLEDEALARSFIERIDPDSAEEPHLRDHIRILRDLLLNEK